MALFNPPTPLSPPTPDGGPDGASDICREDFELPAHASAVADARAKVGGQLRRWGLPDDLGHTAQLVISEFFTNAVLHTDSGRVCCLLQLCERWLRIEVADEGGDPAEVLPRQAAEEDVDGRGLQLVGALAEQWGVQVGGRRPGRVVWAELNVADD